MAENRLLLRPDQLRELRRLIRARLPLEEVWAYGSRVGGTAHDTSDLDLVVRHPPNLAQSQGAAFWRLKEDLSESGLPILVDLHDWATLPPSFHSGILARHAVVHAPDAPEDNEP